MSLDCPNCHKPLPDNFVQERRWSHDLTPGLVNTLRKFAIAVGQKGRNDVHLEHDVRLTYSERANFTKLRFFALVAKVRIDGRHVSGHWLLTRRGSRFLKGLEGVKKTVITEGNRVVDHRGSLMDSIQFHDEYPWFQSTFTWEIADGDVYVPAHQGQLALIN